MQREHLGMKLALRSLSVQPKVTSSHSITAEPVLQYLTP